MDSATTAIAIAIVGVLGTLSAPIVSQRLSARARSEEFEQQRLHKNDEYVRDRQQAAYTTKRDCYIALSVAGRHYRAELMSYLHEVNQNTVDDNAQSRLQEARFTFLACVAEAELTGTRMVLEALRPIRAGITKSYTAIRGLEAGRPEPDGSFEEIRAFLLDMWGGEWPTVVTTMRADLDVED